MDGLLKASQRGETIREIQTFWRALTDFADFGVWSLKNGVFSLPSASDLPLVDTVCFGFGFGVCGASSKKGVFMGESWISITSTSSGSESKD